MFTFQKQDVLTARLFFECSADWFTVIQFKEKRLAEMDLTALFVQVSVWQTPQWVTTFLPTWVVLSPNALRALTELLWTGWTLLIRITMCRFVLSNPEHNDVCVCSRPFTCVSPYPDTDFNSRCKWSQSKSWKNWPSKTRRSQSPISGVQSAAISSISSGSWKSGKQLTVCAPRPLTERETERRKNALANAIHSVYNPLSPLYNNVLVTTHWRQVF